jgi:hypothetical protein
VVGLFAVMAVAGCTTTSRGEPVSTTTIEVTESGSVPSSPSDNQKLPFAGAPKVNDPLDTTRFQQDPCRALTADQAQSLTLPSVGERREAPLGKACTWENADTRGLVEVHFMDRYPYGLSAEYQANEDHKWAYFEQLPSIGGYPAVSRSRFDDRNTGKCTVVVGVSDEIIFEVPVRLSPENVGSKDPCQLASMVAGLALQTMKKD